MGEKKTEEVSLSGMTDFSEVKETVDTLPLLKAGDIDSVILDSKEEKEKLIEVEEVIEEEIEIEETKEESKLVTSNDLSHLTAKTVVGALPLEPCITWVSVEPVDEGQSHKVIGVPGFFDPENKQYFHLDGRPIEIKNFNNVFNKYVENMLLKEQKK